MTQEQKQDNRSMAEKFAKSKKLIDMFEEEDRPRVIKDNTHGGHRTQERLSNAVTGSGGGAPQLPESAESQIPNTQPKGDGERDPGNLTDMGNGDQLLTYEQLRQKYGSGGGSQQSMPQNNPQPQSPFVSSNPTTDIKQNLDSKVDMAPLPDEIKESFRKKPIDTSGMNPTTSPNNLFEDNQFMEEYQQYVGGGEQQSTQQQNPIGGDLTRDAIKNIVRETIEEVKIEEEQELENGGLIKLKLGDNIYTAKVVKKSKAKKKSK